MTETQKDSESKFSLKTIAAAGALLAVGGIAGGQIAQNAHNSELASDLANESLAEREAYIDSIEAAVNAQYDSSSVVGEVSIQQGGSLAEEGLNLVEHALGSDIYDDIKGRIYSPLMDSAKKYIPQPGEPFTVVEVDLNPETDEGNSYVVVRSDKIIYTDLVELPTPKTH